MPIKRSFTFVLIFLIAILVSEVAAITRSLDGTDAPSQRYPWVASIRVDGAHSCFGSIINSYFIVTAARCVSPFNNDRLTARVGSVNKFAGGQVVKTQSTFIYPAFGNFLHDIALLKVTKPFTFNEIIKSIPLASTDDVIEAGSQLFVTAWGVRENGLSSYNLQHMYLSVLSKQDCEREAGYGYGSVLCLHQIEKPGICHGDEGASVVSGTKLVGVVSFYFGNCDTKYPDVASKISYYNAWINDVIQNN